MATVEGTAKLVSANFYRNESNEWMRRAEAAEAVLAERNVPCFWTRMDADEHGQANWNNVWEATCLRSQTAEPSGAWAFCPYCGQPIEVQGQERITEVLS